MEYSSRGSLTSGVRVLVTGANGFIATHIIKQLQEQGYKVRGTVREITSDAKISPLRDLCHEPVHPLDLYEANLIDDFHWENAVKGCMYVIHIANPVPSRIPEDEESEVIRPTVDGLLNVLRACQRSGCVKRVVFTSSVGAISNGFQGDPGKVYTEDDWTDPAKAALWERTKTLAEKAAWDFVESIPRFDRFELTVVHPVVVMGPVLCGKYPHSMEIPKRMLERSITVLPKICFPIVDVRDVAEAHIKAMLSPKAASKRIILSNCNIWVSDMAKIMEGEFNSQGYKIPTTSASWFWLWIKSFCDEKTKLMMPAVGKEMTYDNTRMREMLDIHPRSVKETVLDMCYSLVDLGFVSKKKGYKGKEGRYEDVEEEKGVGVEEEKVEPKKEEIAVKNKLDTPTEQLEEYTKLKEQNTDSYDYQDANVMDETWTQTLENYNRDLESKEEQFDGKTKPIPKKEEKEIVEEPNKELKLEEQFKLERDTEPDISVPSVHNYVHVVGQGDQQAENDFRIENTPASNLHILPEVHNHISDQETETELGLDNTSVPQPEPPSAYNYDFVQQENGEMVLEVSHEDGELVLENTFQTHAETSMLSVHNMSIQEQSKKLMDYTYISDPETGSMHTQV